MEETPREGTSVNHPASVDQSASVDEQAGYDQQARIVADVIRRRKTEKVLALDVEQHRPVPESLADRYREMILSSVQAAGWAPFHYPRNADGIAEPWRVHILWENDTLDIARMMRDGIQGAKGEPALIAACSALIFVTWVPQFYRGEPGSIPSRPSDVQKEIDVDEEHLAAASAMVQNLLLMLTAHGIGNYWSSGGRLRGDAMFDRLGIPKNERLLAAVFVEYPEMKQAGTDRLRKVGKQRENRSQEWIREIRV